MQNDVSDTFRVNDALKQGDALSCLLFNLAPEIAFRRGRISTSKTLANGSVQILGFADYLDLAGRPPGAVADTFTNLKSGAKRMGLVINESKTKYMEATANTVIRQPNNTINIGGHNFEVVNEFIYLGVLTRPDGDTTPEIKRQADVIMAYLDTYAQNWYQRKPNAEYIKR